MGTTCKPSRLIDETLASAPAVAPQGIGVARLLPAGESKKCGSGAPLVTVAVPSLNQGCYLDKTLRSIFEQELPLEVFVADAGSTDETLDVIHRWEHRLAGWRSAPDRGQAAAINESIAKGSGPYVCWLNSDDYFLPYGLEHLVDAIRRWPEAPAVYGNVFDLLGDSLFPVRVEPFSVNRLAIHCIISQPGSLIRRDAWEAIGGLREDFDMALDYDLWWRLYRHGGPLVHVAEDIAVNRNHPFTKTNAYRSRHYREAIDIVHQHFGRVPLKWYIAQPYAIWWKSLVGSLRRFWA